MKASKYYGPEPIKLDTFNTIEAINGAITGVKTKDFGNGPKLILMLDDVWSLALSDTSYRVIAARYGETDDWLDREITVYRGRLRYRGEEQDGICVRVPPLQEGETAPAKEKGAAKRGNSDLDDDIPF
jgi:hypothetical protein